MDLVKWRDVEDVKIAKFPYKGQPHDVGGISVRWLSKFGDDGTGYLGPIIPPSIPMVFYALAAGGVSIAGLFIAGIIPGIVLAAGMMAIAYVIARRRGYPVRSRTMTLREFLPEMWTVLPALLMPVIILGGILGGIFTATEAAAVAVAYAVLVGLFVTKELKWRAMPPALVRSAVATSVVFMLIACSNAVSWLLTTQQVPNLVAQFLKAYASSPWIFLLIINIFLLIVGCLMDLSAAMIMLVPILAPIALTYGVDPLQFGFIVSSAPSPSCGSPSTRRSCPRPTWTFSSSGRTSPPAAAPWSARA